MQIKTLAQILAENETGDKKSTQRQSKSGQAKSKNSAHQTTSRAQTSSAGITNDCAVDALQDCQPQRLDAKRSKLSKPSQHSKAAKPSYRKRSYAKKPSLGNKPDHTDEFHTDVGSDNQVDVLPDTAHKLSAQPKQRKNKTFHPAAPYQPKTQLAEPIKEVDPNSIKSLLAQVKAEAQQQTDALVPLAEASASTPHSYSDDPSADNALITDDLGIDNLPAALKAYLRTPEQRQAEKEEIKAESRLRWLAFYYLSRREHSAGELRQKLLDKEQDPKKIEALLQEFKDKGYQSDHRTALMLIREGIRKGRGRVRIKNDFYKRKVEVPANIDELIDMAMADNEEFVDVLSDNTLVEGVDWLRLAVEARVKKYGDEIPTDQKIKARQLRFLQYRGFKPDICFEAIKYNLQTLDERF